MSTVYPPVGQRWVFDIGPARIEHHYVSGSRVEFHILTGERAGERGAFEIHVDPVGEGRFLVSWQEDDKTTVVHWEEFGQNRFVAFVTLPDASFVRFEGTMWPVGAPEPIQA
jgi:hypothetical protein